MGAHQWSKLKILQWPSKIFRGKWAHASRAAMSTVAYEYGELVQYEYIKNIIVINNIELGIIFEFLFNYRIL